jgi:methylaspartate mutase epsilon subunit
MSFHERIAAARQQGQLVVQPRMGFDQPERMGQGLRAVRAAAATTVGTITLDSYTRVGDWASVKRALAEGRELNGYPIVTHTSSRTLAMLEGIQAADFPVQVRHGSAKPEAIFEAIRACGIDATEGGPVSYCLPYSRSPLSEALVSWRRCADVAAEGGIHLETFGGCMLGQMCPPSLLVALSVLEGLFFAQRGVNSVSLSYAQQTCFAQDVGAVRALRQLASSLLSGVHFHVVLYTYMGVFPRTVEGAQDLLRQSVHIARAGGAERLIVKTVAEAHRIPTIEENVAALELAAGHWQSLSAMPQEQASEEAAVHQGLVLEEAHALIEAVRNLHPDVGEALRRAFRAGYLDVPYCLHRDNAGQTRVVVDNDGSLQWNRIGRLPIRPARLIRDAAALHPYEFLQMLSTMERRFDGPYLAGSAGPTLRFQPELPKPE